MTSRLAVCATVAATVLCCNVVGASPTHIPTGVGVGASGTIYFSSDIENAIYKISKK
jgi:hypothetical protein